MENKIFYLNKQLIQIEIFYKYICELQQLQVSSAISSFTLYMSPKISFTISHPFGYNNICMHILIIVVDSFFDF